MPPLKRFFLIALFFQIGCLALDHSISELEYEDDELHLLVGNSYSTSPLKSVDPRSDDDTDGSSGLGVDAIVFHPKLYDFKECPVGIARLGEVRVDNRLKDENIKLISISGNTVNFHSSFFADKVVTPGNSTSFEVVFLSREVGQIDASLFIHTSKGLFKYPVKGVALPNPYRLRPLVGTTIPVNASYEPLIALHNPHDTRIVIVEMLSSGTDFALRLPQDQNISSTWTIEPFQTKAVMQGSFVARAEGNHTGYIRIKVNRTETVGEYLTVPVEIQVTSTPGIYSPQGILDFGLMVQTDKPKTLSLTVINSEPLPVNIQSVAVSGEINPAVRIEFRPVILESDATMSTVVALITFDPSRVISLSQSNGAIEVRSDCGKVLSIPYTVNMIQGELVHNLTSLTFYRNAEKENAQPRNFSIQNKFSSTVAIYEIRAGDSDAVKVDTFNQTHVILPGETKAICSVTIHKPHSLCESSSPVELIVRSNITDLKLPIICYDGKLQKYTIDGGDLDFGAVELYSNQVEYVAVQNTNPIEVRLKSWGSNSTWGKVDLVGMRKGRMEELGKLRDFDSLKKSLFLQPGHFAVFSVELRPPSVEGMFYGEAFITTDQNQTIRTPFKFSVWKGSVSSEVVFFDKAFPGKISSEKLYLMSTFNHTLNLKGIRSSPPSAVWFSPSTAQQYPEVPPHRRTYVGRLHFDPRKFCDLDCYAGFPLDSPLGKQWISGLILDNTTPDIDTQIFSSLRERFNALKDEIVSNVSVWANINSRTGSKLKVQARFSWPRLTTGSLMFPLTSLDNYTVVDLVLNNPSNMPVVVQAVLGIQYGPSWTNFVSGVPSDGNATEGELVFSLINDTSSQSSAIVSESKKKLQKYLSESSEKQLPGLLAIVPPSSRSTLKLKFAPLSKDLATTMLLLRNNLTGVETVWLKGHAGTGKLTVGNGSPGSSLLFQLTEGLLQNCDKDLSTKPGTSQVTVRRSFIARNMGEIPLEIVSLSTAAPDTSLSSGFFSGASSWFSDGDACEGYGFKILNCQPFILEPNNTHSIDIAFTPDFTLSKVRAALLLLDSAGGLFNYTLVALIPSSMLSKCSFAIPRPWWERHVKIGAVVACVITFFLTCFFLYFDASGVISTTVLSTVRVLPRSASLEAHEELQRLDLKEVYEKVDMRFRKNTEPQKVQTTTSNSSSNNTKGGRKSDEQKPQQGNNNSMNTNSNGSVRNRKGKKGYGEFTTTSNGSVSLISQENLKIGNNTKQDSIISAFVAASGKKDKAKDKDKPPEGKENKDKAKGTMTVTPPQGPAGTSGKKKKNNSNNNNPAQLTQPNGRLKKGMSVVMNKGETPRKVEEETSSTTTESSNPDEITPEGPEKKQPACTTNPLKNNSSFNKKGSKQQGQVSSSSSSSPSSFINEGPVMKSTKGNQGKKESSGSGSSGLGLGLLSTPQNVNGSRDVSPKRDSLWDTPQPMSGEGLSELAAQTEAFVSHWPSMRRENHPGGEMNFTMNPQQRHSLGNGLNFNNDGGRNQPYSSAAVAQAQQQLQQRSKKPGVIGQRPQSQGNYGSHYYPPPPNMMSGRDLSMAANMLKTPMVSGCNDTWSSALPPDIDAWGARSYEPTMSSSSNYYDNATGNVYTKTTAGNSTGLVTSLPPASYQNQGGGGGAGYPYSYAVSQSSLYTSGSSSAVSANGVCGGGGGYPHENNYPYGHGGGHGFRDNLVNPWETPVTSGSTSSGVRHQHMPQHSHHHSLQRAKSDGPMRTTSPPKSSSTARNRCRDAWLDELIAETEIKQRMMEEEGKAYLAEVSGSQQKMMDNPNPPPGTRPPLTDYEEWNNLYRNLIPICPSSGIWNADNEPSENAWPATYETNNLNIPTDSKAVGSRMGEGASGGPGSLEPLDSCPPASVASHVRELEAGLGFNPFTTSIWSDIPTSSSSMGSFPYTRNPNE